MVVSSFAIGVLAIPVFNLSFRDSALVIVFLNILGILPICFFATFGPKFGLRQIVLSRFYFGYHGTTLSKPSPEITQSHYPKIMNIYIYIYISIGISY